MPDGRDILTDIHNRSALIGGGFVGCSDYEWWRFQALIENGYLETDRRGKFRPSVGGLEFLLENKDD